MFEHFPKVRPPLSQELKQIYHKHYRINRDGGTTATSFAQKMERWLHLQVAKDLNGENYTSKSTLELGAGTLNQLQFEPESSCYDIVEPFTSLLENSNQRHRIRNIYADIRDVPTSNRYDRITSCAVLEHICDLPQVIAKSGLLLDPGGSFRASIPSEGTIPWKLAWTLTTGIEFRLKYGLNYGELMKHEHVNTADEIENLLQFFFHEVTYRVFGFSKSISLYRFYECKSPYIEKCREIAKVGRHKTSQ